MKKTYLTILLLLSGCATANMSSVRDPDFPRVAFSKFIVVTNLKYEYMEDFEKKLNETFSYHNVQLLYFWRLFPPLKSYDSTYIENAIRRSGASAFLAINFLDIPDTVVASGSSYTYEMGGMNFLGKSATWSNSSITTINPPQQSVSYRRSITSAVVTIPERQTVWMSFYSSNFSTSDMLFDSYSYRTMLSLQKDSIVAH